MTKAEYIKRHGKSQLAKRMTTVDWPDDTQIEIIGGLIAPHNKCSNLYHALQRSIRHKYVIGGHRQRGPEGWWIAVA
jgi:hypothetical protein